MELVNLYIWGGIGAAFCLFVGALIGHAIYDRQQMVANAVQREHLTAVDEKWRLLLEEANEQVEAVTNSFEFSDKFRKAIVQAMVDHDLWNFDAHGTSPAIMLAMLMKHVAECAIDPKQNHKAKNLYVKGVRAGAKKGREQVRKLMQKSIDNQAMSIEMFRGSLRMVEDDLCDAQKKHAIYRNAVINTLNDKVGLVGVRKSIRAAILIEYQRLRAVEAKKGE